MTIALLAVLACGGSRPSRPATLDTRNDACAWCRMSVSEARFAAQLVAPAEEPLFFDDIGCLRDYLAERAERVGERAVAYVADHRSQAWVLAAVATYGHCPHLQTPMNSHLLAHADAGSRDADAAAGGCHAMTAAEVFGGNPPPVGVPR